MDKRPRHPDQEKKKQKQEIVESFLTNPKETARSFSGPEGKGSSLQMQLVRKISQIPRIPDFRSFSKITFHSLVASLKSKNGNSQPVGGLQ